MCCGKIENEDLQIENGGRNMILTEAEAMNCVCRVKQVIPMRPTPHMVQEEMCIGSRCFAYWRWVDVAHTKGYCSISGKPEVE